MENTNQPNIFSDGKRPLPNATAVLVLGICSIVFSCVYVGLVLGIIGLVLGNKGRSLYKESPSIYEGYGQLNAGWIMSIIGVCFSAIGVLWLILIIVGAASSASYWEMMR